MDNFIKGKKILFLSVSFFGYQNEIVKTLSEKGAVVDFYDERPSNTPLTKALIRINRNLIAPYINKYHESIVKSTAERNYDYVFVLKGESISRSTIEKLKELHANAKFIYYSWDSIVNSSQVINYLDYFDKVLTFDPNDSKNYNVGFLPLFYISDYKKIADLPTNKDIDLLFVGTVHGNRYALVKNIVDLLLKLGKVSYVWMYFPAKFLYWINKFRNPDFRNASKTEFKFTPLRKDDLISLVARSKVVLDMPHYRQTGLTMRTIETLGAKRKLITTNMDIINYDFYDENNILIIDPNNPKVPIDFINTPFKEIHKEIYDKYSLSSWIDEIFR